MKIRPCTINDLEQCDSLCRIPELVHPNGDYFSAAYLEQLLDDKYFLVAEKNKKIIGLVCGEKMKVGGSMVWAITVAKEHRGKSLGSKLLKKFEKNAKKDGCRWVVLYASTVNKKTLGFYKKHRYDIGQKCIECAKDW